MKIEPGKIYMMPLIMGPIADWEKRVGFGFPAVYGEVQFP
jgi:hypothetical protein